jgi:hypothetical protein
MEKKLPKKTKENLIMEVVNFLIKEFELRASPNDFPQKHQTEVFSACLCESIIVESANKNHSKETLIVCIDSQDFFTETALRASGIKQSCLPEDLIVHILFDEDRFVVEGDSVYYKNMPTLEEDLERIKYLPD